MRSLFIGVLLAVLASGCGATETDGTAGPGDDGGWSTVTPDASPDAGADASIPFDQGTSDAPPPDTSEADTHWAPPDGMGGPETTTQGDVMGQDAVVTDSAAPTEDTVETEDTADTSEPAPPPDEGVELNEGWIGGACDSALDCGWSTGASQTPWCEQTGFPNGFCTQPCAQSGSGSWICPDTTYGAETGATISRCITTATGQPTCASECDFALSPTGCRPGYSCVLRQRHGEPHKIYPICLPADSQGWPGEAAKGFDIGDACGLDKDCESLVCLELPGGYCTKIYCEHTGCPTGSTCYSFEGFGTACLDDCTADSQCRENEGYTCDDYGSCWPAQGPVATAWNASVGPSDCAAAWEAGLSPCDTFPDEYVVANKGARNLALCQSGQELASFHMGLGFAPSGDKQVEGDGKTPEGVFYVAELVPNSQYYKAFLVSYPDAQDAAWGYGQGLITSAQKSAIESAQASCATPPQTTALGSYIELHGEGGGQDWTWGCMAIESFELDQVWAVLGAGDTIVVKP